MNAPRSIPLEWSPATQLAAIFLCALPLACAWLAQISLVMKVLLSVASLGGYLHAWRTQRGLAGAVLLPDESGAVLRHNGQRQRGRVTDAMLIGPLALMYWLPENGVRMRPLLIARDAFSLEDWRALRVWLRWRLDEQA